MALAALVAVLCYFLMHVASDYLLKKALSSEELWAKEVGTKVDELQEYVTENHVSSTDGEKINAWLEDQHSVSVYISDVNSQNLIYDSKNSGSDVSNKYNNDLRFKIRMADKVANLQLFWDFDYYYYSAATIIEIGFAFIIFLMVYMRYMNGIIRKIVRMEEDVKILEGGDLNHEIKLAGTDELASLATGINNMRIALKRNYDRQDELMRANKNLVTSMAHDLRTPLTTLLLYLGFIERGKYASEEQLKQYIHTSYDKANRIKVMSDELFERFLVTGDDAINMEKPQPPQYIFEDVMSDFMTNLMSQGFRFDADIRWPKVRMAVAMDYVDRIVDNISSNIVKYADKAAPVVMKAGADGAYFRMSFANRVAPRTDTTESTRIGVRNIIMMMEKMDGECYVEAEGDEFCIILRFATEKD